MSYLETNPTEVEAALRVLIAPGEVFEIRALHTSKWRGMIGYFDDVDLAVEAVASLTEEYAGIYVTLNPVNPACLYRSNNTFTKFVEGLGSKDDDISGRNWLPIDIDPVRPSGISSTDKERRAALNLATTIADTLELTYGFPQPYMASSGNGAHLLYPIALANDNIAKSTVKEFIRTLSVAYSNNQCKVDTSVFNAARIWRLYGTVARKGSSAKERPHRLANMVYCPSERQPLNFRQLSLVAGAPLAVAERPKAANYPADEARWRQLNNTALKQLDDWVPLAFGDDARPYLNGYRISSEGLNRDREEDLSIQPLPLGIVDFGEHDMDDAAEGHRTPVGVLSEWLHDGDKAAAAKFLADAIGTSESEFTGLSERLRANPAVERALRVKANSPADDTGDDEDSEFGLNPKDKDPKYVKGFDISVVRKASDVVTRTFKAKKYLVDGLLPRGCYCLMSRPKMGKSWLTLQLALAKAKGGSFLGNKVAKGKVLLLSLEEQEERIQGRIRHLNYGKMPPPEELENLLIIALDGLQENQFPRGEEGCAVLRRLIENDPEIELIIIDTFSLFRDHEGDYGGSVYDKDYASVMPLVKLASELEISIIAVHHERKGATVAGKSEADFMEAANGSAGLTAAFEGAMRIEGVRTEEAEEDDEIEGEEKTHTPNQPRKLKISGRDIERDVIVRNMIFDPKQGGWYRTGKVNVENAIIATLRSSLSLTFTEIKDVLSTIPRNEIKRTLNQLAADEVVIKTNHQYTLLFAGDPNEVPDDLLDSGMLASDAVVQLVNWRGITAMSFMYDVLKQFTPNTIRAATASLASGGFVKRVGHGTYKLSDKGLQRVKAYKQQHVEHDDEGCDDLL